MASISLEAFDGNIRGKLTQWILPSNECSLPNGFQDQLLSSTPAFQSHILLMTKQDSKAWLLSYSWDLTYMPETPNDWSLLLSILQHLKKPILIVTTPKCQAPPVFWQKCQTHVPPVTCAALKDIPGESIVPIPYNISPYAVFFPRLDSIIDSQFMKIPSILPIAVQQSIQSLDLRSIYRDLRGAGASLCLSSIDSRLTANGSIPAYNATWFYPEINGALRLHISELRTILRTITERIAD
jgi:hypothetical protein